MDGQTKDEALLECIGKGDEAALVALMARHKQAVFHVVYRYLKNEADCAEVTEETFFRVFQHAARFTAKASVKTWIFSIALNLARDRLRRSKRYRGHVSLYDGSTEGGRADRRLIERLDSKSLQPFQSIESVEALAYIEAQIQRLPEKLKFPFIFCVLEEHSYDECAAVINSTRKTVETRIYRARRYLRTQLSNFPKKF